MKLHRSCSSGKNIHIFLVKCIWNNRLLKLSFIHHPLCCSQIFSSVIFRVIFLTAASILHGSWLTGVAVVAVGSLVAIVAGASAVGVVGMVSLFAAVSVAAPVTVCVSVCGVLLTC